MSLNSACYKSFFFFSSLVIMERSSRAKENPLLYLWVYLRPFKFARESVLSHCDFERAVLSYARGDSDPLSARWQKQTYYVSSLFLVAISESVLKY